MFYFEIIIEAKARFGEQQAKNHAQEKGDHFWLRIFIILPRKAKDLNSPFRWKNQ